MLKADKVVKVSSTILRKSSIFVASILDGLIAFYSRQWKNQLSYGEY